MARWKTLFTVMAALAIGDQVGAAQPGPSAGKPRVIELRSRKVAPRAQQQLRKEMAQKASAEIPVGIQDTCHVDSRVGVRINVYVNGQFRGVMEPWGDIYPFVGDGAYAITSLYAVSTCGRFTWGPYTVGTPQRSFHWILRP